MSQKLILVRGLPGSGKTTLAKRLASEIDAKHFEADMFFEDSAGNYLYDASQIGLAHEWCQKNTQMALNRGENVVVSNTFVQQWEMEPYHSMARKAGIKPDIRICEGNYQNIHGVPQAVIEEMKKRWEA